MSEHEHIQATAITEANNRTSEAGLPAYSELVEKLRHVERWMSGYGTKTQPEMRGEVRSLLARIPA